MLRSSYDYSVTMYGPSVLTSSWGYILSRDPPHLWLSHMLVCGRTLFWIGSALSVLLVPDNPVAAFARDLAFSRGPNAAENDSQPPKNSVRCSRKQGFNYGRGRRVLASSVCLGIGRALFRSIAAVIKLKQ